MADTQRTRAALLALFGDNVTGQISEQDLRDFLVTIMPVEKKYEVDAWAEPLAGQGLTDKTARGWLIYSQTVDCDVSFGNVLYLRQSNTWSLANAAESAKNGLLAVPIDSYTSGYSLCILLRKGIIVNSSLSALFSGYKGQPVYLGSTGSEGSILVSLPTNSLKVVGVVEWSDTSTVGGTPYWRFEQHTWAIAGS